MEDIEMGDDSLIEAPPSANEIDRLRHHITLKNFEKALQSAADIAFPNDTRQPYTEVYVLLIAWEEEDFQLPVSLEIEPLSDVFSGLYGFETEIWRIPNENSHNELNRRVLDFVSLGGDNRDHLKIVYYGGHGLLTKNRRAAWASCADSKSPQYKTVKWAGVQNVLEEARSDVLLLLDCCASGCANTEDGRGTTELIAACGFESIANFVGSYSFTQALTTELRILGRRAPFLPFTVGALYNGILTRLQTHMPEGRETQRSPLHVVLTQDRRLPRAIQMAVKPRPRNEIKLRQDSELSAQALQPTTSGGTSNTLPSTSHGDSPGTASVFSPTNSLESSASSAQSQPETPRMVLTIHLKETISDSAESVGQVEHWLRMMPIVAEKVKVEAGFMSLSTLLFVSLPVEMWCYLAKDPAIMPVGLIRSHNLIAIQPCQDTQKADNEMQLKTEPSSTITCTPSSEPTMGASNQPTGSPPTASRDLLGRDEPEKKRIGIYHAGSNTTGNTARRRRLASNYYPEVPGEGNDSAWRRGLAQSYPEVPGERLKNAHFDDTKNRYDGNATPLRKQYSWANSTTANTNPGLGINVEGNVRLLSKTHDISLSEQHIPSIQHLAADLNDAVRAAWPSWHKKGYQRVHVLLLKWADEDLAFFKEVNDLYCIFKDLYHFDVEIYDIPNLNPGRSVLKRLVEFLNCDGQGILRIVYYGVHARHTQQRNASPMWFANRADPSLFIPYSAVQSPLEEADSDVLLLYDCVYPPAMPAINPFRNKGTKELIAACGYETIVEEAVDNSFTHALVETLADMSQGQPFSVGELHSRVLSRLKRWKLDLLKDKDGNLVYEHQPRRTPIYDIFCEDKPRRSIILQPMKPISLSSESPSPSKLEATLESNKGEIPKKKKDSDARYPQVLLSIRLEEEDLNMEAWKEFLRRAPAEAQEIRIEGLYSSFSTLILVKMPVAVWNLLPHNLAYTFVAFVTSRNKVQQESQLAHDTIDSMDFRLLPGLSTSFMEPSLSSKITNDLLQSTFTHTPPLSPHTLADEHGTCPDSCGELDPVYSLASVSWKSRVIRFGHAKLDIGDANTTKIA